MDQIIVDRHNFLHWVPADKESSVFSTLGFDDLKLFSISETSRVIFSQHSLNLETVVEVLHNIDEFIKSSIAKIIMGDGRNSVRT